MSASEETLRLKVPAWNEGGLSFYMLANHCWVLGLCMISFTSHHLLWKLLLLYPFFSLFLTRGN